MKRLTMTTFAALSTSMLVLGLTACTVARDWQYPPDPPGGAS